MPCTNGERIASKSIITVFKARYPDIINSSNIMVVFDDLMRRLGPGLRLEIAIWYVNDQELDTLSRDNKIDNLEEFSTNLTILSNILLTDKPDLRAKNKYELEGVLMNHWGVIRRNFLRGHI